MRICSVRTCRALLVLLAAAACAWPAAAQSSRQSFRVSSPGAELEVKSMRGSIKVVAGEGNVITVKTRDDDDDSKFRAYQTGSGRVVVEVPGKRKAKLEIRVPASCNLDLLCYDCEITVRNIKGAIRAVNTEGEIQLSGVRSPQVEAATTAGSVFFSGDILPSGNYTFKSYSGRVVAGLPSDLDCRLTATSYRGGIGLGEFAWRFKKQTDQFVEAVVGDGRAAVLLWTQEGSIQVHRRK